MASNRSAAGSAKVADSRSQTENELHEALGGEPETATVLRVFLEAEHEFKIRALQHREKLRELATRTAEAKAKLAEDKLSRSQRPETPPKS